MHIQTEVQSSPTDHSKLEFDFFSTFFALEKVIKWVS